MNERYIYGVHVNKGHRFLQPCDFEMSLLTHKATYILSFTKRRYREIILRFNSSCFFFGGAQFDFGPKERLS
jgi:hypothetical protein